MLAQQCLIMTMATMAIQPLGPVMIQFASVQFVMGDNHGRADEQPEHRVELAPFSMATYPVVNEQYEVFLAQTNHEPPRLWGQSPFDCPQTPVCGVSWHDAVAYADWLSKAVGKCYHLPTEAQREYASRGGHGGCRFPWGDDPLGHEGFYAPGLDGELTGQPIRMGDPRAVGPNDFGLFHMVDNVHEWCADYYDAGYYVVSPPVNPQGPSQDGGRRSARGGSWRHHVKYSRCSARSSLAPDKQFMDFGFRLASSDKFRYT